MDIEISFHGVPQSDALEAHIREKAARLTRFEPRVVACRIAVEAAHRGGNNHAFRVRVAMNVPGDELVASRSPDEDENNTDAYAVVSRAFDRAVRLLEDHTRRQRGDVKTHARSDV